MNLYCETHTGLAAEPLLLIHGNLASTVWWKPFLDTWKAEGSQGPHTVYAADWRGCGQNPDWPQTRTFNIQDLAQDFLDLMNQNDVERFAILGHSLGGLIAQQMMIMAPERVTRVLLLDSVGSEGVVFDVSMYEAFRQMAQSSDLTKTVILSTVRESEKLPADFANLLGRDAFKAVKGIGTSVLEILKTVHITSELKGVQTPTLIVHGELDQIIQPADSKKLAETLPNSKLELLKNVGHCWNVEDPKAFTRRARQFFAPS